MSERPAPPAYAPPDPKLPFGLDAALAVPVFSSLDFGATAMTQLPPLPPVLLSQTPRVITIGLSCSAIARSSLDGLASLAVSLPPALASTAASIFRALSVLAIALALVVVAWLVNRWSPDRRKYIRNTLVLFGMFVAYGLSGYGVYVYRKVKGKPVSVIATSTDEPDEQGLHH